MAPSIVAEVIPGQVALMFGVGLVLIYYVAWQKRSASWRLSTFFLGGRNIGASLTAQTYWSTSFSFANGLIYFAVLGYFYGLSVIWFQLPWIAGVWFLIWRLPQLLVVTSKYTLHGFLGSLFGPAARVVASLVTIVGFLGMVAFEIAISTEVLAPVLGITTGTFMIAMLIGIYVAAHVDIGGYAGTAQTDRIQNMLGLIAVILVLYYLAAFPGSSVNRSNLTPSQMMVSFFDFGSVPWPVWVGVASFAPFFNAVDMSHWQAISANSAARPEDVKGLRRAMMWSTVWMIAMPGIAGALLGYAWKGVSGVTQDNLMAATLAGMPGQSGTLSGFIIGFIMLGLAAVGFSSASGYLLSSVQAFSWDLRHHRKIFEPSEVRRLSAADEQAIVLGARLALYVCIVAALILFLVARAAIGDDSILPLQFMLVGIVVALMPATAYALWLNAKNLRPSRTASTLISTSIALGCMAGALVYFLPLFGVGRFDSVFAWSPFASLVVSSVVALVSITVDKRTTNERHRNLNE